MQLVKDAWKLAKPYFFNLPGKWKLIGLFAAVIALELLGIYLLVRINSWYNDFYNSLQELNKKAFIRLLQTFGVLATIHVAAKVFKSYLNQLFNITWRIPMTKDYLTRWTSNYSYYGLPIINDSSDNPDQRISEDIREFIVYTSWFVLGILNAVITLLSFITILWVVSGPLSFKLPYLETQITIPAYLVWFAIIYAFAGTYITNKIGKPLINLQYCQEKREADLRFALMRFRENSESIAFYKGEEYEKNTFFKRLANVTENYYKLIKIDRSVKAWVTSYNQFALIFPTLVASPKLFAGQIKLGGLMQIGNAFRNVDDALSWIMNNYQELAQYRAIINRLTEFNNSIEKWHHLNFEANNIKTEKQGHSFKINHLTLTNSEGKTLLNDFTYDFNQYQNILITGKTGSGKSTVLRALAGFWSFGKGEVQYPENAEIAFIPQKPYIPLGTLLEACIYPKIDPMPKDEIRLKELLKEFELSHLIQHLNKSDEWSRVLSGGEQQKLAMIRSILKQPNILFMDEATSSLDTKSEEMVLNLLKAHLPNTQFISIGHKDSLKKFHNHELVLENQTLSERHG
jgi:putative ATP-binding cassette transporter